VPCVEYDLQLISSPVLMISVPLSPRLPIRDYCSDEIRSPDEIRVLMSAVNVLYGSAFCFSVR
jgi:hypothetical protein